MNSFERFDRMLASSEGRRNNALREIERHRAALAPRCDKRSMKFRTRNSVTSRLEKSAEHRRPTSGRQQRANRANAKSSTGPKTAAGKARAAPNAFRHGLNVPVRSDPLLAAEIEARARRISGRYADAETVEGARRIAEESFMQDTVTGAALRPIIDLTLQRESLMVPAAFARPSARAIAPFDRPAARKTPIWSLSSSDRCT